MLEPVGFDPVAFVQAHRWTFASSMPTIPHEYVIRGKSCHFDDFDAMVEAIWTGGFRGKWLTPSGRPMFNCYFDVDAADGEWRLWRLDDVLNREARERSTVVRLEPAR